MVSLHPDRTPRERASTPNSTHDDRLDAAATLLAHAHQDTRRARRPKRGSDLLAKLERNRLKLRDNYRATLKAAESGGWTSPAGEWLLDNFYVISEQVREARGNLPRRFYRGLPELASGPLAGEPRAFAIADALIARTDGLLDIALLKRFLTVYQEITPLTIGELWAIPIALRHGLLDHLALIADRVDLARKEREAAAALAEELAEIAASGAVIVAETLARRVSRRGGPSTTMFVTELALRLRDRHPALALANAWLEQRITEQGTTLDGAFRNEHLSQAKNQASVGNCITSMRTITATNWAKVFEALSVVEHVLLQDPSGHYPRMDFRTRDRYRHVIERIGKRTGRPEVDVARVAIGLCVDVPAVDDDRRRHVGYVLVGRGLSSLEDATGYKPPIVERVGRALVARATATYLLPVALFTFLLSTGAVALAWLLGASAGVSVALGLLSLLPTSELAVGLMNVVVSLLKTPTRLPKLDLSTGIPASLRTLVAVPMMLVDKASIEALVAGLELRFLANPDTELGFALLSDHTDAAAEATPTDRDLHDCAARGIRRLNELHGQRFILLHRRRVWSESEQAFIGWERKRGKLAELDRLIAGEGETTFSTQGVDLDWLRAVRFVITLDADTDLPMGTAARLVGTLAHPLNRPKIDPLTGMVVDGYAVLQPRVSVSPRSARTSAFARVFSNQEGIDPYTSAVSDVYQDLFGEGSFVGKGIYDVRAFEAALCGRIPEGVVLSHDLLEGLYARAGLVSDVELFDDAPAQYAAASQRRHRWIRGDWQIARWLFPNPPRGDGKVAPNPFSWFQRWKIADNLRRSLAGPATVLLLLVAWLIAPVPAAFTLLVFLLYVLPVSAHWLSAMSRGSARLRWQTHLRRVTNDAGHAALRAWVSWLLLPHEAWVAVDAIVRVGFRRWVSHRGLLEWVPASSSFKSRDVSILHAYRQMGASLALPSAAFWLACWHSASTAWLSPILLGWWLAPFVAARIGRPSRADAETLSADDRAFLRRTARKTWRYFETFVVAGDHSLPPDNYQEDPAPLVAHRTSPTNMGLSLLVDVAALDLGYQGRRACIDRLERSLSTMEKLERYRGHFLNWYETTTLVPLAPRYVSLVDSGNLAGALITLQRACLGATAPPTAEMIVAGVRDVLAVIDDVLEREEGKRLSRETGGAEVLDDILERPFDLPASRGAWLATLYGAARDLAGELATISLALAGELRASELVWWGEALVRQVGSHLADDPSDALTARLVDVARRADELTVAMDFKFLYEPERDLFAIGLDVAADRLDASFYDLLASESRLGSFVAIAKGDVPAKHWYKLGRPLASTAGRRALLSWTGTMFEYLMPSLLMRGYGNTLLHESCGAAVAEQMAYGRERDVPWGVSESAYNARDLSLNYQYGPFGVPSLGIKRGLADDLVIAPYATALAVSVAPRAAVANLRRLRKEGLEGDYGFYESIDYTPSRVPEGHRGAVVRAYMAHHQGMTLLALAENLCGQKMCERFHSDPRVRATELLLEERVPYDVPSEEPTDEQARRVPPAREVSHAVWSPYDPDAPTDVQLLSNGSYSVMITSAGGGYGRRGETAVTRWREDPTKDHWGQFLYVRDVAHARFWSATHQPAALFGEVTEVCFPIDCAQFRRALHGIETNLVVSVATEDDAEVRTLEVANRTHSVREVEITSYAEIVLSSQGADVAHASFGKLFVETEMVTAFGALVATRRPRSPDERSVWAVHVSAIEGDAVSGLEHETDRARFLGRTRDTSDPAAMTGPLSGTTGAVLDPVFSLRRRLRIEPGKVARVTFTTAVADSRDAALLLAEKYSNAAAAARASALAWTQAQSQLHYLDITSEDARLFSRVAARLLYSSRSLRAKDDVIARNRRGQSGLWAYGISGDLPIVLLRIDGDSQVELLREVLHAHEYWRMRGLSADLVILNDHPPSYLLSFQDTVLGIVRSGPGASLLDKPGGIFVRRADVMSAEDGTLLAAAARVVLMGGRGSLADQVDRPRRETALPPTFVPTRPPSPPSVSPRTRPSLELDNGTGGFARGGREYEVRLDRGKSTPAPWLNVLANPSFGATISESGAGYVWADNCHENRITEWTNDPVADPPTQSMFVRDEETGEAFSPTVSPMGHTTPHLVRHGQGYTVFEGTDVGLKHELTLFVAADDPVMVSRLVLRNRSARRRRLSITAYVEWTLGVSRAEAAPHVVTSLDVETGAMFALNTFPNDLGPRVAFADTHPACRSFTGDRTEALGKTARSSRPAMLGRTMLSNTVGAGYDPCAAMQVEVTLDVGEEREFVSLVGQASDATHARALVRRYRESGAVARELGAVHSRWDALLSAIQITTPDRGLDLLVNRWLLYQVTACRLWGRSGLYQSGGAYGFRDQLQDVSSLVYAAPGLARSHLLVAAARQFPEGDVQHWWHPPSGRGVRTRISDDYLWLPFVAAHYVTTTGDGSVWDEEVPFIEARDLEPGEAEAYLLPTLSESRSSLYDHCVRALERSLVTGAHGLPLIGAGDWNDGMNRVGAEGKGESVWMAWFLITALQKMSPFCEARGDGERAERYRAHALRLKDAVEAHAWDGNWYLRAFFDDGTPLGSSRSNECRIDSLSQSWSVISGAASRERSERAMASVQSHLVDRDGGVVRLLAPPFDQTTHDPGYIRGYLPGIRENGGQYTHAAAWVVLAEARLGHGDRAGELLRMINPAHTAASAEGAARYLVEPYVVAADVGTVEPHRGRGGWTWYTGSASWVYRVALESVLGFQLAGDRLTFVPCVPSAWRSYSVTYRRGASTYEISVQNPDAVQTGVARVTLDGLHLEDGVIPLVDDGETHHVVVLMGLAPDVHRTDVMIPQERS